jgi:hypothetical protein
MRPDWADARIRIAPRGAGFVLWMNRRLCGRTQRRNVTLVSKSVHKPGRLLKKYDWSTQIPTTSCWAGDLMRAWAI